jgi:hypothetical protein
MENKVGQSVIFIIKKSRTVKQTSKDMKYKHQYILKIGLGVREMGDE